MNEKQRRTQNLVDPPVQKRLIRRMILHWLLFVGAALTLTLMFQYLSNPFESLAWQLNELWWNQSPMIVALVALLPMFVLDSVKLTNRFAGPIKRLKESIADISEGKNVEPLTFREGDFWQSLAHDFNEMVSKLKDTKSAH